MSYATPPPPPAQSSYYPAAPPAPPPKPSTSSTPARGPPLPPPPQQSEPLELDGGQGGQYQYPQQGQYGSDQGQGDYRYAQQQHQPLPEIPPIENGWLPSSVREKTYVPTFEPIKWPKCSLLINATVHLTSTTSSTRPTSNMPSCPTQQPPILQFLPLKMLSSHSSCEIWT